MTIALIDYKAGTLTSVTKALVAVGAAVFVPANPRDLASADGVVVPGVGHFNATRALDRTWIDAIRDHLGRARPLLGICLGMQWLFESSEEAPELEGLGLLAGACFRLGTTVTSSTGMKVPHVGWNSIRMERSAWVVEGVPDGAQVYFTHSYAIRLESRNMERPSRLSWSAAGSPACSFIRRSQATWGFGSSGTS